MQEPALAAPSWQLLCSWQKWETPSSDVPEAGMQEEVPCAATKLGTYLPAA